MSEQTTREVAVLAPFRDAEGNDRVKGETFTVAYATDRQRMAVNRMVYRGFISFDLALATEYDPNLSQSHRDTQDTQHSHSSRAKHTSSKD